MMDPMGTETAVVRVNPSGQVTVALGTGSHGQGIETTMAQVVAEELGIDFDDVTVVQGDSAVRVRERHRRQWYRGDRRQLVPQRVRSCGRRRSRSPRISWRRRPTTSRSSTRRSR